MDTKNSSPASTAARDLLLNIDRKFQQAINMGDENTLRALLRKTASVGSEVPLLPQRRAMAFFYLKRWRTAFAANSQIMKNGPAHEDGIVEELKKNPQLVGARFFCDYRNRNKLYAVALGAVATMLAGTSHAYLGITTAAAVVIGLIALTLSVEIGYRVILYFTNGIKGETLAYPLLERTSGDLIEVLNSEPSEYHPVRAFDHVRNKKFVRIMLRDGQVVEAHCGETDVNGNVGFTDTDFDPNALNILVLGDSYTNFLCNGATADGHEGLEWLYFLKKKLIERGLGNVRVLNFARSGHGVLQMADTAADLLERFKPDVVLFAFITRDLSRYRYWHISRRVGGMMRYFRFQESNPSIPTEQCRDQYLVDERVTIEWAKERMRLGDRDAIIDELTDRYFYLRRRASSRAVNLLSGSRFYSWDWLFFSTPFIDYEMGVRTAWLKLNAAEMESFASDPQFVTAIAKIKSSGAKILLAHLPVEHELLGGRPSFDLQTKALSLSLTEVVGNAHYFLNLKNPEIREVAKDKYARNAHDNHPSLWAQKLLGVGVAGLFTPSQFGAVLEKARSR